MAVNGMIFFDRSVLTTTVNCVNSMIFFDRSVFFDHHDDLCEQHDLL